MRVSQTLTILPVLVGKEKKIPCPSRRSLEQDSSKDGQKDRSEKGREDVGTNQRPDTLVSFVRNSKGYDMRTPTNTFEVADTVEVFVPKEIFDRRIQDIFAESNKDRKTDHYLVV